MAKIFLSHSKDDTEYKDFFSLAFAQTNVSVKMMEYENSLVNSASIDKEIDSSDAIFVLLTKNVMNIEKEHTRDWIVAESSRAKGKQVWVFEPYKEKGLITITIPFFNHYLVFETTPAWNNYIKQIINSYDNAALLPAIVAGAGAGNVITEKKKDKAIGMFVGGIVATIIHQMSKKQPQGTQTSCPGCKNSFNIHKSYEDFRCPICNLDLFLPLK